MAAAKHGDALARAAFAFAWVVTTAVLGWLGVGVDSLQDSMARLETTTVHIGKRIDRIEHRMEKLEDGAHKEDR